MAGALEDQLEQEPLDPGLFPALRHRDFRLMWLGQTVSQAGTQMQQAAVAWQVYLLTHSPIALGLMGVFRILPLVVFSLIGGVVADAHDRRRLLLITQTIQLVLAGVLAAVTISGAVQLWMIYLLTAVGAGALAFDNPARQAMIPSLVTRDRLTNALSLSSTSFQVASVLGPSLGGLVIAIQGVGGVYVVNAVSFFAVIIALFMIHPPAIEGGIQRISVTAAVEGLRFVWHKPIIRSTMSLDFIATFFGSAMALLPIFARDVLHAGSAGYGLLYASPAVGAVAAGIVMSLFSRDIHRKGLVVILAVAAYGAFTVVFGLSHVFLLSLVALAGTGAADTVSMILRQTIRQGVTPDALRGRMTSVNMVFVMGGPQLGEVEAGLLARLVSAPFSVITGGVGVLVATAFVVWAASGLRHYRD